jgi:hypothetical protein
MATRGERQALLFLGAVAVLGAGTQAYHAHHAPVPTAALDRQIAAVETSASRGRSGGRVSSARKRGRGRSPVSPRDSGKIFSAPRLPAPYPAGATPRIDLDAASAAEIERLPGIGPAIARRIEADREAKGPFGCLAALGTVKGIGPVRLGRLDSLVAFSGTPRPICTQR